MPIDTKKEMKVRATLRLTPEARMYIGKQLNGLDRTKQGLATRDGCIAWLQKRLDDLHKRGETFINERVLSEEDKREGHMAVQYLRAAGKSETYIHEWLLLQRARFEFPDSGQRKPPDLGGDPGVTAAPAKTGA